MRIADIISAHALADEAEFLKMTSFRDLFMAETAKQSAEVGMQGAGELFA